MNWTYIMTAMLILLVFLSHPALAMDVDAMENEEEEPFGMSNFQVYDLVTAAMYGRADIVEIYLAAGKHLEQVNEALVYAADNGFPQTVRALLTSPFVDANYQSGKPLMLAILENHLDVIHELLTSAFARADPNFNRGAPIAEAIGSGSFDSVRMLASLGADLRINNDEPLLMAVVYERKDVLLFLIFEAHANIHAQNGEPLRLAARYGLDNMVMLLLQLNADPSIRDSVALQDAVSHSRLSIASLLLLRGANPNALGGTLLLIAIRNNDYLMVHLLLVWGADATINDNQPMIEACSGGRNGIIMLLIQYGADPRARLGTPLRLARANENWELVRYLETFEQMQPAVASRRNNEHFTDGDTPASVDWFEINGKLGENSQSVIPPNAVTMNK